MRHLRGLEDHLGGTPPSKAGEGVGLEEMKGLALDELSLRCL